MLGNEQNQVQFSLKNILGFLLSKWYIFILSLIVAFSLAYLQIKRKQPAYQVESSLFLETKASNSQFKDELMKEMGYLSQASRLEDEIGILTSYSMIAKTVERLNIGISYFTDAPFERKTEERSFPFTLDIDKEKAQIVNVKFSIIPLSDEDFTLTAKADESLLFDLQKQEIISPIENVELEVAGKFGQRIEHEFFSGTISKKDDQSYKPEKEYGFSIKSINKLTENYRENLEVKPLNDESNIINLSYQGVLIEEGKRFLDTLMEVYLDSEVQKKSERGQSTIDLIEDQIASAEGSLKKVEGALESVQSSSQVIDAEVSVQMLTDQRNKLEQQLTDRRLVAQSYQSIYDRLRIPSDNVEILAPAVLERQDPVLSGMLLKLSELQQKKAKDELTAVKNSPLIAVLSAQIQSQKNSVFEHISNSLSTARSAVSQLESRIAKVESKLYSLPGYQKKIAKAEREVDLSSDQYKYLQQKRAEAEIAMAGNKSESYVVDKARLSDDKPVSPNKAAMFVIAFLLGLGLPTVGLIIHQSLNNKILRREDLELSTDIPILGIIIKSDLWNKVVSPATSNTRLAESFRSSRIQLQYLLSKNEKKDYKIIGVTSSSPNEGKSFCAANFAATYALSGKKTLLMDLDLRKPDQKEYFTYDNSVGLHGYLVGRHRYTDFLTKIENIDNLWLFPSGPVAHNSLDLLDGKKFKKLIESLKKRFDYVILDTPPIGHTSDYYIIKDMVDFTVYVVRHNLTSSDALGRVNQLYEEDAFKNNMGILINGVKDVEGYNYGEGASYGYGKSSYGYSYNHQNAKPQNIKDKIRSSLKK